MNSADHDAAVTAEVARFRESSAVIEQAKGILVQLLSVDADRAFAVLKRISQHENIKLVTLAGRLVSAAAADRTPVKGGGGVEALLTELARG
jgi:AmiR/NasT family two-component response regulator